MYHKVEKGAITSWPRSTVPTDKHQTIFHRPLILLKLYCSAVSPGLLTKFKKSYFACFHINLHCREAYCHYLLFFASAMFHKVYVRVIHKVALLLKKS